MIKSFIPLTKINFPPLPDASRNDDYRKEELATTMIELLKVLKLKRVGLIGHDWGGWIGFLMCLQAPEKFTHYLALGITSPVKKLTISPVQYRRFLYQLLLSLPFVGEFLLHNFSSLIEWSLKK